MLENHKKYKEYDYRVVEWGGQTGYIITNLDLIPLIYKGFQGLHLLYKMIVEYLVIIALNTISWKKNVMGGFS